MITTNLITSYILILILSCIEYWFHYRFINYIRKDLTTKQKAHILSIKSSLTLLLIGVYFNYYYFVSGFNEENFFSILDEKNNLNFGILVLIYFTAYLIMDMYIGYYEYPEYMKSLSGNIHHCIYTVVNCVSIYFGVFPMYLLHMLSELPTFILSIGSFDSLFRNDQLFGISFLLTRIIYHSILIYIFRNNKLLFGISSIALCLHLYWFYGWIKKYGIKTLLGNKSPQSVHRTSKNKKQAKNIRKNTFKTHVKNTSQ